jgi:tetratricopeptide (TPR) repeat protein
MNGMIPFLAAFLTAFGLGLPFLAPGLVAGDGGELVTAAVTFGIPHPPGYPLWTLLAHGFSAFPLGCPAFRITLLSFSSWALATALLGALLARRWGKGWQALAIGYGFSFFIAFGPLCLDQAIGPEVYGLHYLLSACFLALILEPSPVFFIGSCFILGLGLAHHHTLVLIVPAWAWAYRQSLRRPFDCLFGASFVSLGLSLYLLLPIRSNAHPFDNWGHPNHWNQFLSNFMRHQYGGDLAGGSWSLGFWDMLVYGEHFVLEGWGLSVLLLATALYLIKSEWRKDFSLWLALVGTAVVFPWLVHTAPNPENNQIAEVFFPPVFLWAAPLLLTGLRYWSDRMTRVDVRRWVGMVLLLVLVARLGVSYFQYGQADNLASDRMGRNYLLNLPIHSVIYSEGDTATFPLAYLQGVLGLRKDVTIYDRTGGLFEDLYHILDVSHPMSQNNYDLVRMELERESKLPEQPVFYTETEYAPGRLLAVNGLLFRVSKGDMPQIAQHGLWPHFRVPYAGVEGDYLSRETAARFYIFRGANGLRSGMSREFIYEDLQRAAELGFDNSRLINNIGMEYLNAGLTDNAERSFLQVVEVDPQSYLGWYNLGVLAEKKGLPAVTEERYRLCLKINPSYSPARDGLAVALFKTGRLEDAVDQWQELLKRDKSYPPAFRNLGIAVLQIDPTHAHLLLEQYLKMSPNAPDRVPIARIMNGGS